MMQVTFRTKTALPAITLQDDGSPAIVRLPQETELTVRSKESAGWVEVEALGQVLKMFAVDLRERAEISR